MAADTTYNPRVSESEEVGMKTFKIFLTNWTFRKMKHTSLSSSGDFKRKLSSRLTYDVYFFLACVYINVYIFPHIKLEKYLYVFIGLLSIDWLVFPAYVCKLNWKWTKKRFYNKKTPVEQNTFNLLPQECPAFLVIFFNFLSALDFRS